MKIIVSGLAGVLLGADKGSIRYKHQFKLFISGYCLKVTILLLKINILLEFMGSPYAPFKI